MNETPFNPYASPSVESQQSMTGFNPQGARLATRGERLGGAIIDGIVLLPIVFPLGMGLGIVLLTLGFKPESIAFQVLASVLGGILGAGVFLLINGYLLATRGQTVGKWLIGTRIVNDDGSHPEFVMLILKRYLWLWVLSSIPNIGGLVGFINAVLIFRGSRKCLHDDIAGTSVIKI